MRTQLSPLMRQITDRIRSTFPNVTITENLPGDSVGVRIGSSAAHVRAFAIEPSGPLSYDAPAVWPVYVVPVPPPRPGESWDCRSLEDIVATLRWPDVIPNVPVITAEEARKRAGLR